MPKTTCVPYFMVLSIYPGLWPSMWSYLRRRHLSTLISAVAIALPGARAQYSGLRRSCIVRVTTTHLGGINWEGILEKNEEGMFPLGGLEVYWLDELSYSLHRLFMTCILHLAKSKPSNHNPLKLFRESKLANHSLLLASSEKQTIQ